MAQSSAPGSVHSSGGGGDGGSGRGFLRSKVRVGSCKGPVDYRFKEHVFHADDTPAHVKQSKQDIVRWKQRKLVGQHASEWNNSTATGAAVCVRNIRENWVNDRSGAYVYNYRAEQTCPVLTEHVDKSTKFHISTQTAADVQRILLQQSDPVQRGIFKRTQELPTHFDLDDATPWNNSTALSPSERDIAQRQLQERANASTKARRKGLSGLAMSATDMIGEQVRAAKREGRFATTEPATLRSGRSSAGLQSARPRSQARSAGLRTRSRNIEKRDFHSGTWEFNELEGRHMWSDTGSFVYESKGDVVVTSNRDRWNLSDWTNS